MQLRSSTNNMGRAKRKFRHAPQNAQRRINAVPGLAGHEVTSNLPQTVAGQPTQTPMSSNTEEDELQLEGILRARSVFLELTARAGAGNDKTLILQDFGQPDATEEGLESCFKEFAQMAGNYVKGIHEEFAAIKATFEDTTKSLALRTEARLQRTKLMLAIPMETVDLCLCMAQLFNVPKTFSWPVFGYNQVRISRAARHGIHLEEEITGGLVQIDDDSGQTVVENTKKDKKKKVPRKPDFSHMDKLLAEYHQNIVQFLEDIRALSNSIKEEEETLKMPCLPELTTFFDQSVTVDIPKHILQALSDIAFLVDEMHVARPDVIGQRNNLLKALTAWRAIDKDFWEYGKKNLHHNPIVARYEHARRSYLTTFVVWKEEELRASEYIRENGLGEKLLPATKQRLGWAPCQKHREDEEKAWQSHVARLYQLLPLAEQLANECDETWARRTERNEATAQQDDWWRVLVP